MPTSPPGQRDLDRAESLAGLPVHHLEAKRDLPRGIGHALEIEKAGHGSAGLEVALRKRLVHHLPGRKMEIREIGAPAIPIQRVEVQVIPRLQVRIPGSEGRRHQEVLPDIGRSWNLIGHRRPDVEGRKRGIGGSRRVLQSELAEPDAQISRAVVVDLDEDRSHFERQIGGVPGPFIRAQIQAHVLDLGADLVPAERIAARRGHEGPHTGASAGQRDRGGSGKEAVKARRRSTEAGAPPGAKVRARQRVRQTGPAICTQGIEQAVSLPGPRLRPIPISRPERQCATEFRPAQRARDGAARAS